MRRTFWKWLKLREEKMRMEGPPGGQNEKL